MKNEKRLTIGNIETVVFPNENRGYFEHETHGELGGLWFDGNELVDYDGVFSLPEAVIQALRHLGFIVDSIFE